MVCAVGVAGKTLNAIDRIAGGHQEDTQGVQKCVTVQREICINAWGMGVQRYLEKI